MLFLTACFQREMSGSEAVFGVRVQPETGAAGPSSRLHPVERERLPGPGGFSRGHRLLSCLHVGSEHRGKCPQMCTIFCLEVSRATLILSRQLNFICISQFVSKDPILTV